MGVCCSKSLVHLVAVLFSANEELRPAKMEGEPLGQDENGDSFRGRKAVEHFNPLGPMHQLGAISQFLHPRIAYFPSPFVGKELPLRDLPETPWPASKLLPTEYFAFQRYDYTRRSLLTAALYVQRPLMKDEARAVACWSAKQYAQHIGVYQFIGGVILQNHFLYA